MHDIWSPWHGCHKKSPGCLNCYMFYLDKIHNNSRNSDEVYKTSSFNYPLQKDRTGAYKIKSGEQLRVCMSSDFFVEEADLWREEAFDIMRKRKDVIFFILTKRPERVKERLPKDILEFENIIFNVTCENQKMADERIPILLELPFKHKGIMCAPFIGEIKIKKYLETGKIEQVIVGGENYDGARPCNFDWVKSLHDECVKYNIRFCFIETGTKFIKDGKVYNIPNKDTQSLMAYKSNMNYEGKKIEFKLYDEFNNLLTSEELYTPFFRNKCHTCGSKMICNGCSNCGKCEKNK